MPATRGVRRRCNGHARQSAVAAGHHPSGHGDTPLKCRSNVRHETSEFTGNGAGEGLLADRHAGAGRVRHRSACGSSGLAGTRSATPRQGAGATDARSAGGLENSRAAHARLPAGAARRPRAVRRVRRCDTGRLAHLRRRPGAGTGPPGHPGCGVCHPCESRRPRRPRRTDAQPGPCRLPDRATRPTCRVQQHHLSGTFQLAQPAGLLLRHAVGGGARRSDAPGAQYRRGGIERKGPADPGNRPGRTDRCAALSAGLSPRHADGNGRTADRSPRRLGLQPLPHGRPDARHAGKGVRFAPSAHP